MPHLELTQSATDDLKSISDYTLETWGEEQRLRYLNGIYKKFTEIVDNPSVWRFRNDLFPQCQVSKFGRHLILFISKDSSLIIVRVLHGAMDLRNHIPGEFK